ncbi:MAG: ribonuclease HI [Chromatiales bacterium]|nr:ribonuclease HI [Chromatiales bacterium]
MTDVELYTDGACRGNPGPGGWGVLLRARGQEREICGGALATTNNRMELMAAIEGLQALTRPCSVAVYTDSEYLRKGIGEWLPRWKATGWRTAARKPVKNEDLWRRLEEAVARHEVEWHWVKGHSGHAENERADALANRGLDDILAAVRAPEDVLK